MIVGSAHKEHHILLVTAQEDALAPLIAVIRTILQQVPAMVSPHQALAGAEARTFDLVIIDMQDCTDPLSLIRDFKERHAHVPVLAMVPYGNVTVVEQVLDHGADDYISQPIALERLRTTLRNALRLRALLQGNGNVVHGADFMGSRHLQYANMLMDKNGRVRTLREIEESVIDYTIKSCDGCITQAARVLGVGRSTLYRKLQEKMQAHNSRENQHTRPIMVASPMGDS